MGVRLGVGKNIVKIVINYRVTQRLWISGLGQTASDFQKGPLFLCAAIFLYCFTKFTSYRVTVAQNYEPESKRQEQHANNSPWQNKPKHKRAKGRPGRLAFRIQSVAGMTRIATRSSTSYFQTALATAVSGHRTALVCPCVKNKRS